MLKYTLKRLVYIVFVFFLISIVLFGVFKLVPGDPARLMMEGSQFSKSPAKYEMEYQANRKKLNLDKPIHIQYLSWMGNMLTGDLGFSINYKEQVSKVIQIPMKLTMKLNIVNLILVFLITIPLGITTAVRKKSIYDNTVQVITILGYCLPSYIIALTFIYIFSIKLEVFPISGVSTVGMDSDGMSKFLDELRHMGLPVIVMTFGSLGAITRYVRASMIECMRMDYIRTARAKGLREKVVIYSHAFRNSMIPVVTIFVGWFVGIFGGSVIIESMFLWPGMGKLLIDSLNKLDFSVVLAISMFYVLLSLVGNLITDICYGLVDPRVKLS